MYFLTVSFSPLTSWNIFLFLALLLIVYQWQCCFARVHKSLKHNRQHFLFPAWIEVLTNVFVTDVP